MSNSKRANMYDHNILYYVTCNVHTPGKVKAKSLISNPIGFHYAYKKYMIHLKLSIF